MGTTHKKKILLNLTNVGTLNILFLYTYRIQAEMTQFCDGMNCVYDRFSELMKLHPKLLSPIFTSSMKAMGRQDLNKLFLFVRSDPYSNDWQREEDTVYGFQKLLIDIESKYLLLTHLFFTNFIR